MVGITAKSVASLPTVVVRLLIAALNYLQEARMLSKLEPKGVWIMITCHNPQ
jgi:hypothetical protein